MVDGLVDVRDVRPRLRVTSLLFATRTFHNALGFYIFIKDASYYSDLTSDHFFVSDALSFSLVTYSMELDNVFHA